MVVMGKSVEKQWQTKKYKWYSYRMGLCTTRNTLAAIEFVPGIKFDGWYTFTFSLILCYIHFFTYELQFCRKDAIHYGEAD